jgi:hypothetical protein
VEWAGTFKGPDQYDREKDVNEYVMTGIERVFE